MDLDDIDDAVLNQLMDDYQGDSVVAEANLEPPVKSEPQVGAGLQIQKLPRPEHLAVLSKTFGHRSFRPLQWEIISSIIYEKRDVCAVMSTGYGKSLCFQFPSMFLDGVTLVISPLIALMEDQVLSLTVSNIPACLLGSAQKKQGKVIDDIFNEKYSIIYLTPEFCSGDIGNDILIRMSRQLSVVLIAIDEAHCISSWGHDFRHAYRHLGNLRTIFARVPVIAVTATATHRVRDDIVKNLKLRNPFNVCTGFDRPNIYFEANRKGANGIYSDLTKLMIRDGSALKFSGPTIIYCITRKETESVAEILKTHGIKCLPYHAGLSLAARQEAHELFVKDKIEVVVATIAFGMGIDKPDIRNVVHYGCSQSIENYYQEVGRSGRDGLPAHCVTFYSNADFGTLRRLQTQAGGNAKNVSLMKMEEYLTTLKCRRRFILEHFEEKADHLNKPRRSCCDTCTKKLYDARSDHEVYEGIDKDGCYDFTDHARIFLRCVASCGSSKFGMKTFIKIIRGSSAAPAHKKKDPLFGCGKAQSDEWWLTIGRVVVQEGYLQETSERTTNGYSYTAVTLTNKGRDMIASNERLIITPPSTFLNLLQTKGINLSFRPTSRPVSLPSTSKKPTPETQVESQAEMTARMVLYRKLLDQRGEMASNLDCMPYMVASNAALMSLARLKPATLDELRSLNLDGFTEAKIHKFGNRFLQAITGKSNNVPKNTDARVSIKDALAMHPLPEISMTATAEVSCNMLEAGSTLGEIAQKRDVTKSTITSHLVTGLKLGRPIKMAEFGVTEESRDAIVKAYRTFYKTGFTGIRFTPLKEQLPPEITFDEIKVVLAYLQVRCHLQSLNVAYEDFEDFQFSEVDPSEVESEAGSSTCQSEVGRKVEGKEQEKREPKRLVEETREVVESPAKKFKVEEATDFDDILDSPPRPDGAAAAAPDIPGDLDAPNSAPEQANGDSRHGSPRKVQKFQKKNLPPWLVVKKIH